jgi:hypothetical protein
MRAGQADQPVAIGQSAAADFLRLSRELRVPGKQAGMDLISLALFSDHVPEPDKSWGS